MASAVPDKKTLLKPLDDTARSLEKQFQRIDPDRKKLLEELAGFVSEKADRGQAILLNFICTHNSRRSHMAQLWAQAAAHYYNIPGVSCFSGGTEATAFNPGAADAMRKVGFDIQSTSSGANPVYRVKFSDDAPSMSIFSKKFDDPFNPSKDFAAVMTCSHADEQCPFVPGTSKRIAITYGDPKDFDGTPQAQAQYLERALQIGREMLFAFSRVRS